jgi:hypothetical protein
MSRASWLLARMGLWITAVDNGRVRGEVLSSGLVEHVRADDFHYCPSERVDWMVCDIADRPADRGPRRLLAGRALVRAVPLQPQAAHEAPNCAHAGSKRPGARPGRSGK